MPISATMPVRIDEAGAENHAGGIENLAVARIDARRHRADAPAFDQHVAALEVAEPGVHREDSRAAHEQPARHRDRGHGTISEVLRWCSA